MRHSAAEEVCSREGFCLSTHVLALVPTTPNPTIYGPHLRFDKKPPAIVAATASRFSLARILKPAACSQVKPRPISPAIPSPQVSPVLAAGPKDGDWPTQTPKNARKGRFRPKKMAFYAESAETFQAINDLAAKRLDPVMSPVRHVTWSRVARRTPE
jgi:hypothetical protein